jgi:hypothetical protein
MNIRNGKTFTYVLVPCASYFAITSALHNEWWEFGISIVVGAGMTFTFFKKKVEEFTEQPLNVRTAKKIRTKLATIEEVGCSIPRPNVVRKIKTFLNVANQIANDLDEDPDDARAVQNWSNTFLDETLTIINSYNLMIKSKPDSNTVNQQIAFDEFLSEITKQSEKLLDDLKTNNLDNLNISLSVMMTRLKNEGIN